MRAEENRSRWILLFLQYFYYLQDQVYSFKCA